MEPYIEFIVNLQNNGFWLVKVAYASHVSDKICVCGTFLASVHLPALP